MPLLNGFLSDRYRESEERGLTGLRHATAGDASVFRQVIPPLVDKASVWSRGSGTLSTSSASIGEMIGRAELAAAIWCRLHTRIARWTVFTWAVCR